MTVTCIPSDWYPGRAQIQPPSRDPYYDPITGVAGTIGPDMNPAHIIRFSLVDQVDGAGIPESFIDDVTFRAAADTFHSEGLGLSIQLLDQGEVQEFIQEILDHTETVLFFNPVQGKFNIRPLRGDYVVGALPLFNEDNSRIEGFTEVLPTESVNEMQVTYTNPDTEEEESISVHNLAGIALSGGSIIAESRDFPGFRNAEIALKAAQRELSSSTDPLKAVRLYANREAGDLFPGSPVRISNEYHLLTGEVFRVVNVDRGRPGDTEIEVSVIEDVFGRDDAALASRVGETVPSWPRRFGSSRTSTGNVVLRWTAPESITGIAKYQYRIDGGAWVDVAANLSQVTVNGLLNNREYAFEMRAVNAVGAGDIAGAVRLTTARAAPAVPGEPENGLAELAWREVEVSVDPVTDINGSTILYYEYEVDDAGNWTEMPAGPQGPNAFARVSGLQFEETHAFRVRAVNHVGAGPQSDAFEVYLGPAIVDITATETIYAAIADDWWPFDTDDLPDNDWPFEDPGVSGRVTWHSSVPNLSTAFPVLVESSRQYRGVNSPNPRIQTNWSPPARTSRFGQDGDPARRGPAAYFYDISETEQATLEAAGAVLPAEFVTIANVLTEGPNKHGDFVRFIGEGFVSPWYWHETNAAWTQGVKQFGADEIVVNQLDAIAATIGRFQSASSGERVEISDNYIRVYDDSGTLRVEIGQLS